MIKALALLLVASAIRGSIHYHFHGMPPSSEMAALPAAHAASATATGPVTKLTLDQCTLLKCNPAALQALRISYNECLFSCMIS